MKFLNNKTLAAFPNVLKKALGQLVIVKTNETEADYKSATLKELRYQLSQKRQYSKKQIMKKYLGMCYVYHAGGWLLTDTTHDCLAVIADWKKCFGGTMTSILLGK